MHAYVNRHLRPLLIFTIYFVATFSIIDRALADPYQDTKLSLKATIGQQEKTYPHDVVSKIPLEIGQRVELSALIDGVVPGAGARSELIWETSDLSSGRFLSSSSDPATQPRPNEAVTVDRATLVAIKEGTFFASVHSKGTKMPKSGEFDPKWVRLEVTVSGPKTIEITPKPTAGKIEAYIGKDFDITATAKNAAGENIMVLDEKNVSVRLPLTATTSDPTIALLADPQDASQTTGTIAFRSGSTLKLSVLRKPPSDSVLTFTVSRQGVTDEKVIITPKDPILSLGATSPLSLTEGQTFKLTPTLKAGTADIDNPGFQFDLTSATGSILWDPSANDTKSTKTVKATTKRGSGTVTVTHGASGVKETIEFNVTTKAAGLQFTPPQSVQFTGQPVTVTFTIVDSAQKPIPETEVWALAEEVVTGSADTRMTGRILTITPKSTGPIAVAVRLKDSEGKVISSVLVNLSVPEVSGFAKVRVALDIIDEVTAGYLFGKQAARDFYALRVRLFNNLKAEDGRVVGDSILAYSESIEMRVKLDKNYVDTKTPYPGAWPRGAWHSVDSSEFISNFTPAEENPENPIPPGKLDDYAILANGTYDKAKRTGPILVLKLGEKTNLFINKPSGREQYEKVTFEIVEGSTVVNKPDATSMPNQFSGATVGAAKIVAHLTFPSGRQLDIPVMIAVYSSAKPWTIAEKNHPLLLGEEMTLTVVSLPKGRLPKKVEWKTSDPGVAKVHPETGKVQSIGPGVAIITATDPEATDEKGISRLPVIVTDLIGSPTLPPSVFYDGDELKLMRHRFLYRPYSYDIVVNTFDPRSNGSSRSMLFRALDFVGTTASFLTGVRALTSKANPVIGPFSNLFVPGLDKLIPNLKDTQRQNFVSMTMKQIEEIPFGSDVSKVIFVPKSPIRGVLRAHEVRISEVDTSYFNITVAVVKKNTQSSGNAVK